MPTTNNLNITLVETAQAQKEVTVNQAISTIDAILNTGAIDKDLATPPGSPNAGDVYIVGNSATGDWAGKDDELTYFDQTWRFIPPSEGIQIWVNDEDLLYAYNGSSWQALGLGRQTIYIPASQITPSATNGSAALATTSIGAGQPDIHTLDFDASAVEYAEFSIRMPKRWNEGGGSFSFEWSHASTATNFDVVWAVQALAIGNSDSLATSFSTADTVTDTGGTTDTLYKADIGNITIYNGPAASDTLFFRIHRLATDAGDNLAIDARLHGISFEYFSDAMTDD